MSIFLIGAALIVGYWYPVAWTLGIVYALFWLVFSVFAAFHIRTGFYVATLNSLNPDKKEVCITFDDGPVPNTGHLLNILHRHNVKASFFCIGQRVEEFPEMAQRIVSEGHSIGNHSYRHTPFFPFLSAKRIRIELNKTQFALKKITRKETQWFRPPFGITNPLVASALSKTKLRTIGWNVRSLDTTTRNPEKIIRKIKRKLKPGSIILLHDNLKVSGVVLEEVLKICARQQLKPISLDQAFNMQKI